MSDLDTFSAVLEVMPDAVFVVAAGGEIVAANAHAEKLTGYARDELVGLPVERLVPVDQAKLHVRHRAGYFRDAHARPMGTGLDIRVVRKDGIEVPADIALGPIELDGKRMALASMRDMSDRRRIERRLLESEEALALVDERERIGRELHDGAIQTIFAIGMSVEGLAARTADPALQERLRTTVAQLDGVIKDLRNYIYGLRPSLVSAQPLEQALRQLVDDFAAASGVTTVADVDPEAAHAVSRQAGEVVLLAGEALSNVGRHAHALTCRLTLRPDEGGVVLEIEDDGQGFDVAAADGRGQGLRNLRQRATRLRGSASIESGPGEGTTLRFLIPT